MTYVSHEKNRNVDLDNSPVLFRIRQADKQGILALRNR